MMKRIFEFAKEPLYGRATSKIIVRPFAIDTLKQVLYDYNPNYKNEDLLAFYMMTGGIAKYMEQMVMRAAVTKETMLDSLFEDGSFFLDEGRSVLIDEFGKDYSNYFSVLSLIASSKTDRGMIESILGMPVGGYLDKLEKEYGLIRRVRPFMAKEGSRYNKYIIEDNFLNFWFRFIYKYRSAIEIGNLQYVRDIVERDYEVYSGLILEKYFRTKLIESKQFSDIQGYWDRKGENEIDIVAINEMQKKISFCEVKRNRKKINLDLLKQKSFAIIQQYPTFEAEYLAFSIDDM
jgi:AAA+ ATPase superfamily predicted ATPase